MLDESPEERALRAAALRAVANLLLPLGEIDLALDRTHESLAIYATTLDEVGRARALLTLGQLLLSSGDIVGARDALSTSVSVAQESGAVIDAASAAINLAETLTLLGDLDSAWTLCETALADFGRSGLHSVVARANAGLGAIAAQRGEFPRAIYFADLALAQWRELGVRRHIANSARLVGYLAMILGQLDRAELLLEESVALFWSIGDPRGVAAGQGALAGLAERHGDYFRAGRLYAEFLRFNWGAHFDRHVGDALINVGLVEVYLAFPNIDRTSSDSFDVAVWRSSMSMEPLTKLDASQGVRHIAAGETLLGRRNIVIPPEQRETCDRIFAAVRAILGNDAFATAYAEGQVMPLERAVADVLDTFREAETQVDARLSGVTASYQGVPHRDVPL
jgi:tetratricopeptide (TPR) repeat protein